MMMMIMMMIINTHTEVTENRPGIIIKTIGQSASRTVVNGEMSLRRLKL
jgi:hypothetical protein